MLVYLFVHIVAIHLVLAVNEEKFKANMPYGLGFASDYHCTGRSFDDPRRFRLKVCKRRETLHVSVQSMKVIIEILTILYIKYICASL